MRWPFKGNGKFSRCAVTLLQIVPRGTIWASRFGQRAVREIVPRFKIVPRGTIEASVTGVDGICEELWMTVQVEAA